MPKYIGASEAAKQLGVTRTVFYRLKDRGLIPFKEVAGRAVFDVDMIEVVKPKVQARKNGRPPQVGG